MMAFRPSDVQWFLCLVYVFHLMAFGSSLYFFHNLFLWRVARHHWGVMYGTCPPLTWNCFSGARISMTSVRVPNSHLSTQLIKSNYLVILPTDAAPQFLWKLAPLFRKRWRHDNHVISPNPEMICDWCVFKFLQLCADGNIWCVFRVSAPAKKLCVWQRKVQLVLVV